MRINYFHHELYFFKETLSPSFSPLQKRIFAIASIAIGCLVACMVLYSCCNFFSKKIQADKAKKALDKLIKKINENPQISLKDIGFKDKNIDQVLEFAKINGSKLQNLNLHGFIISNKNLKELAGYCPNLHQLFISSDKISDDRPCSTYRSLPPCKRLTCAGASRSQTPALRT